MKKEACFYKKIDTLKVKCELCPHQCELKEGEKGICGVREVQNGVLYSLNFGEISSICMDPIEKKPLYNFKPGSNILSVGSFGCNFNCSFCQNFEISQQTPSTQFLTPSQLITYAENIEGNLGIAFTYNEPSIWFEYIYEVCQKLSGSDLKIVLVSNGYISEEPFKVLLNYVDAINIDLKAFTPDFYKKICCGEIEVVKNNIIIANHMSHVEVTTLLIDGYNTSSTEIKNLSTWLASVNPDIPLHLTRYHPSYKFNIKETNLDTMNRCKKIASKYLHYVYMGNVTSSDNSTYCPHCGHILISRLNSNISVKTQNNKCPKCGHCNNIIF
jgi:pyruvate formate lyase activating enzyme